MMFFFFFWELWSCIKTGSLICSLELWLWAQRTTPISVRGQFLFVITYPTLVITSVGRFFFDNHQFQVFEKIEEALAPDISNFFKIKESLVLSTWGENKIAIRELSTLNISNTSKNHWVSWKNWWRIDRFLGGYIYQNWVLDLFRNMVMNPKNYPVWCSF